MNTYNISILGAGNGGRAFAAYLSKAGHQVHLVYNTFNNIATMTLTKKIVTEGVINGTYPLTRITNNYKAAVKEAEIILVVLPASLHLEITNKILPYLRDGQILLLNPGRTWGAIEVYNQIKKYRPQLDIAVGETQTLLFTCRKKGDKGVYIGKIKDSVDFCFYPEELNIGKYEIITDIFPNFNPTYDIRLTSLSNFGAILHPSIALLNSGAICRREPFNFYRTGVTPEIAQVVERLDIERMRILHKLQLPVVSFLEWVANVYGYHAENYYDAFQHIRSYAHIEAPKELNCRYFSEDVPTGLVPLASLGKVLGIKTPVMNSIINISNCLMSEDYFHTGRTMERVGVPEEVLVNPLKLNIYLEDIHDRLENLG